MENHLDFSQYELFFQAFKLAPIGMGLVSSDGQWLQVNASLCHLLGYSESELLDSTFQDVTHPDDLNRALDIMNQFLEDKIDSYQMEKRYIHKNGFTIWVLMTISVVRDEHKQPLFFISQIKDITQSKIAEEELRRSNEEEIKKAKERFESVIRNNADAIWMVDLQGTILEVNASFETMFGWSPEEIEGKKLPIIPDFLKESMDKIHQSVKTGKPVVGLETIRQRKDGSLLDVEATLSPIRDHRGKVIGITGICRDITRRKRAEEEVREKTTQLESFIENNADAVLICNNEGIVQRVNKTFKTIFGWSQEEIIGMDLNNLPFIPAESLNETNRMREQLKKGQLVNGIETIRKRKNGEIANVLITIFPIQGSNNGWSVTLRDITEWKNAQEHLQNSEKLSVAGQLAAGIAHEVRNPLTAINGFIDLMRLGYGEKQQYFDIMKSEIQRIELILNEFLVLAKPQITKFERKDVRLLLGQVIALLDTQAILNNIEFVTEFKPCSNHVHCDENQLKQVFINFIKNSIEAMPKGGKITIQIGSTNGKELLIRFIDQGCGIPKEVLSKLGQPFYTTKEKGTGLGFMISKKIIEHHSGTIHIESELNLGTTIEITLPISHL